MYESRFTVLRVRGIPIGVNWSWLFIAAFLTWSLGTELFPHSFPGLASSTYLVMGAVSALLFFASIVAHELGHAFRALKEGMRIDGITLWLLGGVARFVGVFPSAGAELRIAVAGPAVSVALVALFAALDALGALLGLPLAWRGVLEYLAGINLLLVAFNLVPALPLDGGRILRALLWKRRRDFASATRAAARLGQAFGFLLGGIGIVSLTHQSLTTGLWLSVLGVFIVRAARSEAAYGAVDTALGASRVRDLMTPAPAAVPPRTTIADFLERTAGAGSSPAYPVAENGQLLGLISVQRATSVPPGDRARHTVADSMTAAEKVPRLSPDTPVLEALGALQASPEPAVVTDGAGIRGVVSMADVAHALQLHLGPGGPGRPRGGRTGVAAGLVVALAALLALSVVYHPPLYVLSPGPASDVSHDMTISGVPARVPAGRYLLTTVRADQFTVLRDLVEAFRPHRQVVAASQIGSLAFQDDMFKESQVLAAAAAAREKGMKVTLTGSGAEVTGIAAGSPATGVLRTGDVVVGVDGAAVHTEFDLHDAVQAKPAGTRFSLTVRRGGSTVTVTTASARTAESGRRGGAIGLLLVTRDIAVQAPFTIRFTPRPIGGPSAGLAYALAISDALGNLEVAGGRTVAATGAIDATGTVGDVGGVDLKAIGARTQGARIFLVPADEVGPARGLVDQVKGVASLSDALSVLREPG